MIWNNVAERADFTGQMITASGYAFYMNGTDVLLPEYSEVVAWMPIPMPYEEE